MSLADQAVAELESTEQFFNRSTRSLTDARAWFAKALSLSAASS